MYIHDIFGAKVYMFLWKENSNLWFVLSSRQLYHYHNIIMISIIGLKVTVDYEMVMGWITCMNG